ncbi:MAG: hypothetical protein ACLQNE_40610 [Thermoguttaceae bacterium]
MRAILFGGGQEQGLISGTVAIPLVVGLGMAAVLTKAEHRERGQQAARIKKVFLEGVENVYYQVTGDVERSQAHVVNASFPGIDSEAPMGNI